MTKVATISTMMINIDQYNDDLSMLINGSTLINIMMINNHLLLCDDQHQLQLDITVARDFATYTALQSNSQVRVTDLR